MASSLENDIDVKEEPAEAENDAILFVECEVDLEKPGVEAKVVPNCDFSAQFGETGLAECNTPVMEGGEDGFPFMGKADSLEGYHGVSPSQDTAAYQYVKTKSILRNPGEAAEDAPRHFLAESCHRLLPSLAGEKELSDAGTQVMGGVKDGVPQVDSNYLLNGNSEIFSGIGEPSGFHFIAAAELPNTDPVWPGYHECIVCGHKTKDSGNFGRHVLTHTKEKPFACDQCDYRASQAGNLKRHKLIHKAVREKPYKCSLCNYRCDRAEKLERHMIKHVDGRPYSCDQCEYSGKTEKDVKNHQRLHSGEKPHACTICDFRAIQKYSLIVHMRTHTGERPFVCKYKRCKQSFRCAGNLKQHEMAHSKSGSRNYICGTKCGGAGKFKDHMHTHSEEEDEVDVDEGF